MTLHYDETNISKLQNGNNKLTNRQPVLFTKRDCSASSASSGNGACAKRVELCRLEDEMRKAVSIAAKDLGRKI